MKTILKLERPLLYSTDTVASHANITVSWIFFLPHYQPYKCHYYIFFDISSSGDTVADSLNICTNFTYVA
jgi:hypothetical protein